MQNLIDNAPAKRNYNFIDNIRCIAMMSIVADHSFYIGVDIFAVHSVNFWVYLFNMQLIKFGTISFFLMAGFLLGDKFTDYTPAQYLGRRFKNTFGPWIIWSLFFLVVVILDQWIKDVKFNGDPFVFTNTLVHGLGIVYLFSNYWFIINFLVCIAILLLFKRQLYSLKLGAVLLACTLFYSVNVYLELIPPIHTTALFGFVFFLWLGAQLNKQWDVVKAKIESVPLWAIVLLVLLTIGLGMAETNILFARHSVDPFNTLRFTNLLFSVSVFILLVKIKNLNFVRFFKPRETTYGIYLIHYIFIYSLLPEVLIHFGRPKAVDMSPLGLAGFLFARFLFVYIVTNLVVRGINASRFKWIIGGSSAPAK